MLIRDHSNLPSPGWDHSISFLSHGNSNCRQTGILIVVHQSAYSKPHPVKITPLILDKRFKQNNWSKPWSLPAPFGWPDDSSTWSNSDSTVRLSDASLEITINQILNSSQATAQLASWQLADEPYQAVGANNLAEDPSELSFDADTPPPSGPDTWYLGSTNLVTNGPYYPFSQYYPYNYPVDDNLNKIRNDLYYRMKYIQQKLIAYWDTSDNHPIYAMLRHWGNYDYAISDSTQGYCNASARVSHVLQGNNYLWNDGVTPGINGYVAPNSRWRDCTRDAVNFMLNSSTIPHPLAYFEYFDGWSQAYQDPDDNNKWTKWTANPDELRYAIYTTLVQGARGVGFWNLSKSESSAFNTAELLAKEVNTMVPYLMTNHPSVFAQPNEVYLTTSTGVTSNVDFLVRVNSSNSSALLIICNDSATAFSSIDIHFPSTWRLNNIATSIKQTSPWDYSVDTVNNIFSITGPAWRGRAFIVTKQ